MMTYKTFFAATAVAFAAAIPASAQDAKIYPYHAKANYCPDGLQPVVYGGDISCGEPNQSITYFQAKHHPIAKSHKASARGSHGRLICPIGEKSCYYQ